MNIYAKSRRRINNLDYVAIVESNDGCHQMLLSERGGKLWPFGINSFSSVDAAKVDCQSKFNIHGDDWSELPDNLLAAPEESALDKLWRKFDEVQQSPWESDPVVKWSPPVSSADFTREYKPLLLGTWQWGRYTLEFNEEDSWRLSFEGEMLISPLSLLKTFSGRYSCVMGTIGFMDGQRGGALQIVQLDAESLVLTNSYTFTGNFKRVGCCEP